MTTRAPDNALERLVSRHHAALRRSLALRHGLRAAGNVAVVVTLGGGARRGVAHRRAAGLGAPARRGGRRASRPWSSRSRASCARCPSFEAYLERIEERFPVVRSWLRNALDFERRPPAHTSPELVRALGEETSRRLADVPLAALRPALEARRPLAAMAVALAVVAALGLAFPARTERSWHTLLDPRTRRPAGASRGRARLGDRHARRRAGGAGAGLGQHGARPRLLRDGSAAGPGTPRGRRRRRRAAVALRPHPAHARRSITGCAWPGSRARATT